MNQLIGSATSFSSGGPGKGMHCRAITNLMQKHSCVDGAASLNHHFSDSGLFGMTIEGPGAQSDELMKLLVQELNGLRENIDEVELNRAKNILKMQVLMAMERTDDRLEEIARNYMTYVTLPSKTTATALTPLPHPKSTVLPLSSSQESQPCLSPEVPSTWYHQLPMSQDNSTEKHKLAKPNIYLNIMRDTTYKTNSTIFFFISNSIQIFI